MKDNYIKTSTLLSLVFLLVIFSGSEGFEGYVHYPMHGNVIFPMNESPIEITEMRIAIISLGDYGRGTKIRTEYLLRNTDGSHFKSKVAFPVLSNCVGDCTETPHDFKVTLNDVPILPTLEKMKLKDYYLMLYGHARSIDSKKSYHEKQGIMDKDYDMSLFVWHISAKVGEKVLLVCEYTIDAFWDPGIETLIVDLSPLILWRKLPDRVLINLTLPQELIDNLRRPSLVKWPKVDIKPNAHKIVENRLEWSFSKKSLEKVTHLWLDVDYRAPGVVGD